MPYSDKDKRREYAKNWARMFRARNPKKHREYVKKWRTANYDKFLEMKRKFYRNHKEVILERYKTIYQRKKMLVFEHYSNGTPRCSCCNTDIYEFLTIDHKNGGGVRHRKSIGPGNIYSFIIKNNFPKDYDVLCYNCNCSKAFNRICPHKVIQN